MASAEPLHVLALVCRSLHKRLLRRCPRQRDPLPPRRALGRCVLVPVMGILAGTALRHQFLPFLGPRVALTGGTEQPRNEIQEKFL